MGLHVPRITINFDFKESSSFGELSLISLGYGLHQAWIYSSMFDKGGIFGSNVLQAGPFNDHLSLAYFVSILVYGVLLLVASALDTKLIRFFHSAAALGGAAALGALGTLMLLLPEDSFFTLGMIQALSGILTGAGSSVLLIAWGIMFARQDSASIVINAAQRVRPVPAPNSLPAGRRGQRPSARLRAGALTGAAHPCEPGLRQPSTGLSATAHQPCPVRAALRAAGVLPRRGPGHHAPNLH